MNRSTSEQIGTKQPGTRGGIEVILSFCSKCRRGLQALVASEETTHSFTCPTRVLVSLFLPRSIAVPGERYEVKLMLSRPV